jgi:predicted nucleotidyltransferase
MLIDSAALAPVFARHPVIAAYLFGSQATGSTTPLSDVDVAVILEPTVESPGMIQVTLISDLTAALRRNDVDVVILNNAPPLLRHRATSRGRLIYCRDDAARAKFEAAALRGYVDTKPLRDAQDRALLDRYADRR